MIQSDGVKIWPVYFNRKLENFEAAENYCAEIGRPDAYMQSVIFLSLYSFGIW